jgi:hypothetical protein
MRRLFMRPSLLGTPGASLHSALSCIGWLLLAQPVAAGTLSSDQLFISPLSSVLIFIFMLVCLEYGSRFFLRMQQPPSLDWKVLDHFTGNLFDVEARRRQLPDNLGLRGVRSLHAISSESDPVLQSQAASNIATLVHLAAAGSQEPPPAQLRALASLVGRFTPSSRGMAALGIAFAALDPARAPLLLECGAVQAVLELACDVNEEPDAQGAAALALALMAGQEALRSTMLAGRALPAIEALLGSRNPDAVRCAACALAEVAAHAEAPARIVQALPPPVLVMICRSEDQVMTSDCMLIAFLISSPRTR